VPHELPGLNGQSPQGHKDFVAKGFPGKPSVPCATWAKYRRSEKVLGGMTRHTAGPARPSTQPSAGGCLRRGELRFIASKTLTHSQGRSFLSAFPAGDRERVGGA
jgi:hypothetical protein